MIKNIFVLICFVLLAGSLHAQTIWVVRHAEKSTAVLTTDPELSETGKLRAEALTRLLETEKITQVYSTPFKRTRATVAGVATGSDVEIRSYQNVSELAATVSTHNAEEKILIAGHSNTVPDILRALGAEFKPKDLSDEDYDYIFKIVRKDNRVTLTTKHYGAEHHARP
ncbi:phosphoglycerate mutase family protein [Pedobacter sp. SYP-B3415]|uniref:phosphoglycerate mutase family protein n=1 Tax=Pedobacter sp. SYP-B3415 TaxID=2496641 RepID=UPI00101CE849|nr:phosphoglycerate mutase family protein [Pedobacter sp. SYP-B3415]